ncbi:hypothetical protein FGO68_gene2268 [Halteria grandinella]|uniref:Uncharacterized protein n=1 Tax=Halteria grandinella TaxID=5974 RepID=A0A8J8NAN1_HALGN|nr:hypothetical protein FGO68_gene2268 [Halteria grandinella]
MSSGKLESGSILRPGRQLRLLLSHLTIFARSRDTSCMANMSNIVLKRSHIFSTCFSPPSKISSAVGTNLGGAPF